MTKYKKYLRAHVATLNWGSDSFPYKGIESVEAHVLGDYLEVLTYYTYTCVPHQLLFDRDGTWSIPSERLYRYCSAARNGFYDYVAWLRSKEYDLPYLGFDVMKDLYLYEKVQIAFLHMRAGIMDELVFYAWIDKLYQDVMGI